MTKELENRHILPDLLAKVAKCMENKPCVFRGENKRYDEISCTLYRSQKQTIEGIVKEQPQDIDITQLHFPAIEREIIKKAQRHFPDGTRNLRVLTELQHYGGKTTLIDFTENVLIALFFACNGEPQEDGRIICLATDKIHSAQDLYPDLYFEKNTQDTSGTPSSKEENDIPVLLAPLSKSTETSAKIQWNTKRAFSFILERMRISI